MGVNEWVMLVLAVALAVAMTIDGFDLFRRPRTRRRSTSDDFENVRLGHPPSLPVRSDSRGCGRCRHCEGCEINRESD